LLVGAHVTADNKRRHTRVMVKVLMDQEEDSTFRFILDKKDSEAYLFDFSTDFSEGGIFVRTNKKVPVGTEVNLRFHLPNSDKLIEAVGRVTWINSDEEVSPGLGIGIKFVKLSQESTGIIQEFIETLQVSKDSK